MNTKEIIELILSRYVVIIGGRYSRGKSLSLTALNFFDMIINGRNNILTNMPIKSNIKGLDFNVTPLIETKIFDNFPEKINILYDEIHLDLNARSHQDIKNRYINLFGRDIAKMDARLRASLQFFDTLEKVMGLLLEVIIIPEYVNSYSKDTKEDNKLRLENKDFIQNWTVIDKRENETYEIELNLYPFIFMYNTKYKTYPLWVNHHDYIQKLQKKKTEYEFFNLNNNEEINLRKKRFDDGFKDIGKILIR